MAINGYTQPEGSPLNFAEAVGKTNIDDLLKGTSFDLDVIMGKGTVGEVYTVKEFTVKDFTGTKTAYFGGSSATFAEVFTKLFMGLHYAEDMANEFYNGTAESGLASYLLDSNNMCTMYDVTCTLKRGSETMTKKISFFLPESLKTASYKVSISEGNITL